MDLSPLSKAIPSFGSPTLEGFDLNNLRDGQRVRGLSRQMVRFYRKKIVVAQATEVKVDPKTGATKPIKTEPREVEKEFVHIVTPGDKNEYDDVAQDFHRREFWAQYNAFRSGKAAPFGTPIEECSFIPSNLVTELKYLNVHTAEQLADCSDLLCNQIANGWEMREFAKAIVKASTDNKSLGQVSVLRGELEKSQELIKNMQMQMNEMRGMLLNAKGQPVETEAIKRGPGRPAMPKEA